MEKSTDDAKEPNGSLHKFKVSVLHPLVRNGTVLYFGHVFMFFRIVLREWLKERAHTSSNVHVYVRIVPTYLVLGLHVHDV